jgi:hypothetical protein
MDQFTVCLEIWEMRSIWSVIPGGKRMDAGQAAADIGAELEAMKQVGEALASLDDDARGRVLHWASDRFGLAMHTRAKLHEPRVQGEDDAESAAPTQDTELPDSFAEFFSRLGAKTDPDRALATAYWFKRQEGRDAFSGFDVNAELTQLGHKVGNITKALGSLMQRKPQLILQKGKSGKSRQARKTYAISHAGEKEIERRLRGEE